MSKRERERERKKKESKDQQHLRGKRVSLLSVLMGFFWGWSVVVRGVVAEGLVSDRAWLWSAWESVCLPSSAAAHEH